CMPAERAAVPRGIARWARPAGDRRGAICTINRQSGAGGAEAIRTARAGDVLALDSEGRRGDDAAMESSRAASAPRSIADTPPADGPSPDVVPVDVLIGGAGMVGLSLAAALGGAGLEVALVDRADPAHHLDAAFDGRTSAIAYGSQQGLAGIG